MKQRGAFSRPPPTPRTPPWPEAPRPCSANSPHDGPTTPRHFADMTRLGHCSRGLTNGKWRCTRWPSAHGTNGRQKHQRGDQDSMARAWQQYPPAGHFRFRPAPIATARRRTHTQQHCPRKRILLALGQRLCESDQTHVAHGGSCSAAPLQPEPKPQPRDAA
jgi:hypothetical protein